MPSTYSWEGPIVSSSEKEDVIRAAFATRKWVRDSFGNMNKGNLRLSFTLDTVRLKKYHDGRWIILKTTKIDKVYRKLL